MSVIRLLPVQATFASLDLTSVATQLDTVIEAVTEGPEGNQVSLSMAADSQAAVKAELDLDAETADLDTIIQAKTAGLAGNDITVTITADSVSGVTLDDNGGDVLIAFESGVSDIDDFETAVGTSSLIEVKTGGTGATVLNGDDTMTETALAGGLDSDGVYFEVSGTDVVGHFDDGVSTVEDFEDALAADEDVAALMVVKTAGTSAAVLAVSDDDFSATNLTSGGAASSAAPSLGDGTVGVQAKRSVHQAILLLRNVDTASSTTKTATGSLWGYSPETGYWYSLGEINEGSAVAETSADAINYAEKFTGLSGFSRFYFEIGTLGGAGTEVEVFLKLVPADTTR